MTTEVEIRPGIHLNAGPALFLEQPAALVVADVHWGYATSQRVAGRLVPQWGDDDIEARLSALIEHYRPRLVVIAGDFVHGPPGAEAARAFLDQHAAVEFVLVGGNHDRRLPMPSLPYVHLGDNFIHHGDKAPAVPPGTLEIVGHHHPAATWHDGAGTALKLPALVEGPHRLILPAFSPWAAGVPWNHRLLPGERLWFVSPRRIFALRPPG